MASASYVFEDPQIFVKRHVEGTEREHQLRMAEITRWNAKRVKFAAILICSLDNSRGSEYLVLVRPGDLTDGFFPQMGDTCKMILLNRKGKDREEISSMLAKRIDTPSYIRELKGGHSLAAFSVIINPNQIAKMKKPLMDDDDESSAPTQLSMTYAKKGLSVRFELENSDVTMKAEITAITKLTEEPNMSSVKQQAAFKYLMNFKDPMFRINLFQVFPWMAQAEANAFGLPRSVIELYSSLDDTQQNAYKKLLSDLPCGIGILPGGPGGGKTHWNLVVAAMAQSKPSDFAGGPGNIPKGRIKILYLLDNHKPLDDISTRLIKTYKAAGLSKWIVQMQSWDSDFTRRFLSMARMNERARLSDLASDIAPNLDEAAWDLFQKLKTTRYQELANFLPALIKKRKRSTPITKRGQQDTEVKARHRALIKELYEDLLEVGVDLMLSTPVAARTGFDGLFKPDIVIFDKSPNARELSNMIAIANFEPTAWLFSGDYRQTRPLLASDDPWVNPHAAQLTTSTMERAAMARATPIQLLINHRALGNLHTLASGLFYNGDMIAPPHTLPETTQYIRTTYLSSLLGGPVATPRIVVQVKGSCERQEGTSFWNENHMSFVYELLATLVKDSKFKRVGENKRGSILVISPYKEAVSRYRTMIEQLPGTCMENGKEGSKLVLCEARSIDAVQGDKADFVILDFVRNRCTQFTDDANRLCVALTRAVQAEVLIMNPTFGIRTDGSRSQYVSQILEQYNDMGQITTVEWSDEVAQPQEWIPEETETGRIMRDA